MASDLKVFFVSSEVHPFSKSGGLADVASALPKALHESGHDVRLFTPKYGSVDCNRHKISPLNLKVTVPVGENAISGRLHAGKLDTRVPVYFLENEKYYHRESYYGGSEGDYLDNAERFIFFCRAAIQTLSLISFKPDIIHLNDWQTGLIPFYLKHAPESSPETRSIRTVFTIHNLAYQGNFSKKCLSAAHIPWSWFHMEGVEFYDEISFLKTGLVFSDCVTTVSKTYREEILNVKQGHRMDGVLLSRIKDFHGVVNGIDTEEWDPLTDSKIPHHFDGNSLNGKKKCRKSLLDELGITLQNHQPLLCVVSRLVTQKGINLILDIIDDFIKEGLGLVILGTGDLSYEKALKAKAEAFPEKIHCLLNFDAEKAHRVIAASDILLMPSAFEPCGLTQMQAMRYGTIPVVHAVGGLNDTVQDFSLEKLNGTGFKFFEFSSQSLLETVKRATEVFQAPSVWKRIIMNAMTKDYSWKHAAGEYLSLYHGQLKDK